MKLKIQDVRRREMPSKFGGNVWTITSVKFEGVENPQFGYDLKGFSKKADEVKAGDVIEGYMTTGSYAGKNGPVTTHQFNKISAEYVYNLLLKLSPDIEASTKNEPVQPKAQIQKVEQAVDESESVEW